MFKVSIVVPVYNAEKTLERCLDSIMNQTFDDIETLLINDGSTDSSLKICERYSRLDSRFKVLSQQNAGPSAARNKGLDNATGEYVYFVDSDDYIADIAIEKMYHAAVSSGADITICGFYRIKDEKISKHEYPYSPGIYEAEDCRQIAIDLLDNMSSVYLPPYSWIRMIKADFLNKHQLRYADDVKRSEDYLFTTELHFKVDKLCLITNETLYYYIDNEASITNNYVQNYWSMSRQIYADLLDKLPRESIILKKLDIMLFSRSMIALNNACRNPAESIYRKEINEIITDPDLRQSIKSIPFRESIRINGAYYLLMRWKLFPIVKWRYSIKRFNSKRKNYSYKNY